MKKTVLMLIAMVGLTQMSAHAAVSSEVDRMNAGSYYQVYNNAYTKHEHKKYAEAYPDLLKYAQYGEKIAQYLVGTYLVTGTGTEQNVFEGLVWMGVALEQEDPIWQRAHAKIYDQLKPEQKAAVDKAVAERKALYGADAQKMTCKVEAVKIGTLIRAHRCNKDRDVAGYVSVVRYPQ